MHVHANNKPAADFIKRFEPLEICIAHGLMMGPYIKQLEPMNKDNYPFFFF